MHAYSLDLRQRIVDAYQAGEGSVRELAERFAVASRTVQRYLTAVRTRQSLLPRQSRHGPPRTLDASAEEHLRALLELANDRTDAQFAQALAERASVHVSARTINRTWERLGVTRKKKRSAPASRTGPTYAPRATPSDGGRPRLSRDT